MFTLSKWSPKTSNARNLPSKPGPNMKMINDELALAQNKSASVSLPFVRRKRIPFRFDPGQLAAMKVQLVVQFRETSFLHEQFLAGGEPLFQMRLYVL